MTDREDASRGTLAQDRLITAAERLFALYGVDAVSIRQVVAAAGQKNVSAVHYHFGSRDGLLEAIIARRTAERNAQRAPMLAAIDQDDPDLFAMTRAVVGAMAAPQFHGLDRDAPTYHRRFVKQIHMRHGLMEQFLSKGYDSGLRACFRMLRARMPETPVGVLVQRYLHANAVAIDAAANLEDQVFAAEAAPLDPAGVALLIESCIDSMAAIFMAPVPERTRALAAEAEAARAAAAAAAQG